ncbi:Phytochrome-like protein cph2 [compost metagenome]
MHELIANLAIARPGSPQQCLTLSIGLAVADPANEELPASLVARSDQALYQAKHGGRNQTCIWTPACGQPEALQSR